MRHSLALLAILLVTTPAAAQTTVGAAYAATVVGKGATVCGKIESFRYSGNVEGQPTFLHPGGAFPKHPFTVRTDGSDRGKFNPLPDTLVGRMICVTGSVALAQGNLPEMVLSAPGELSLM